MALYHVTRRPGAPPRRAGRTWPQGQTRAELTAEQLAALQADPHYTVACASPAKDGPTQKPPRKRAPRKKRALTPFSEAL